MILETIQRFFELGGCLVCGQLQISDKGVCATCSEALFETPRDLFHSEFEAFIADSLYEWIPGYSDEFSNWIMSLKRAPARKWTALAEEFSARKLSESHVVNLERCLVPCPAGAPSRQHAQRWAEALSRVGCGPVRNLLEFDKGDLHRARLDQKKLNRQDRRLISMKRIENITMPSPGCAYIFVDDIVTTGSTALSAWKALGKPQNFQVWCVATRPRLRSH
ncbi:MAG: hypothetical protein JNM39_06695 [Bdellovibrionaceae bacterium]|nr:hypothetical protein [Pseudobdellovibrionaceae bacterium]